jgi:hypothetical protein
MSKVKIKKIKVPIGMNDEDLSDMFNQMLGTGSVNLNIAYPRYKRVLGLCEQLIKLFELLASASFMNSASMSAAKTQLTAFCEHSRVRLAAIFSIDFADYEWNLSLVEDDLRKKFTEVYEEMKRSDLVNTFVILCDRLIPYKRHFIDVDKLNPKFIMAIPGVEWCPFPFVALNLKDLFLSGISPNTKTFFMTILNKSYEFSRKIFEEIQSPDIDVDQFVDLIMRNIDELQCRPELSRCKDAFQKIKESVHLLKDRFNGYYRDFISTKDSTIMMQHFILDVSKSTSANVKVTHQFRTIISYYRKIAQNQITNPKIRAVFEKINESLATLERGTENLVNINSDEDGDADCDSASDADEIILTPTKSAMDLAREASAEKTVEELAAEIEGVSVASTTSTMSAASKGKAKNNGASRGAAGGSARGGTTHGAKK